MASAQAGSWIDRRPRSSSRASGRKTSLQNPCATTSGHSTSITPKANSPTDHALDPPPLPSWHNTTDKQRPRSLVHQRTATLESSNVEPGARPSRRHSLEIASPGRMSRRSASCSVPSRTPLRSVGVKRWDGMTRTVCVWDGLRRDPELWFDDGDCHVYLHARGQSRRGASFCVPRTTLARYQCHSMFNFCFAHITGSPGSDARTSTKVFESLNTKIPPSHRIEVFIPAPASATKAEAFEWHLTTRNFFAYIFRKPLVGKQLGQALVDLEERIEVFCSHSNSHKIFLSYLERQGYRDLVDCPDYALAMLYYAEHSKLRSIWIDAFVHCVGMNKSLSKSPEYLPVSSLSKALIVRAYSEMETNLGRATATVRDFLAQEVSLANLGLSNAARAHIDRFRSFLHSFYVEKFGYWPPPEGLTFPKVMFRSMYNDFKNLYGYIVDLESTADLSSQKPASGGICVLQHIESFDSRHKFPPLPHPLPLLPKEAYRKNGMESQRFRRSFRVWSIGSKQNKSDRYMVTLAALTEATNRENIAVTSSPIVQEYQRFERTWAQNHQEEKFSMTDARKVRWIMIYGTLQYLVSALRAPKEVRDTEHPQYPLCCLVIEQSPWQLVTKALASPRSVSTNTREPMSRRLSKSEEPPNESSFSIEPDCLRDPYFTHTNIDPPSRRLSVEIPAPLKIPQLARNKPASSLKRFPFSSSRNSVKCKTPSHRDIMVRGYDNGLNETSTSLPPPSTSQPSSRRASMSLPSTLPTSVAVKPHKIGLSNTKRASHIETGCNTMIEPFRNPEVGVNQGNEYYSSSSSAIVHHLDSSSNSTTSADSPCWSDGASASSSGSLQSIAPTTYRGNDRDSRSFSSVRHPPIDLGLSPLKPTPNSSTIPVPYGEFAFGFETENSDYAASQQRHAVHSVDPAIGVALGCPPTSLVTTPDPLIKSPKSIGSLRSLSAESRNTISLECSRVAATVDAMSPLRSHPPSNHSLYNPARATYPILDMSTRASLAAIKQKMKNEEALMRSSRTGPLRTNHSNPASMQTGSIPTHDGLYPRNGSTPKSVPYKTTGDFQQSTPSKDASTTPIKDNEKCFKIFRRKSFRRR